MQVFILKKCITALRPKPCRDRVPYSKVGEGTVYGTWGKFKNLNLGNDISYVFSHGLIRPTTLLYWA
jgi:hypothetical protein